MPVHLFIRSFAGREFSVEPVITFRPSDLGPYEAREPSSKAEQGAGANRRGCSVSHALRNSNPPSCLHADPRPGGRNGIGVRRRSNSLRKEANGGH